ncbi:nuclear transport factor 2 family protein [Actinomadura parmotrematis]|uniref:Nuclear transport factor 2 family protein n=1 Tax=Actinomadura parmotrematis TaxID=2864039 RepID=A0ABS7G436_9ACTN|nr:nuclear transport factor 2 family protein [Actinomadura parmotrematis]MBW8487491.1 nuclear transport factor 2 family protein [Actinomadura parmotrematis]
MGAEELRDIADERLIRRLLAAYVDAVNRGAWAEFGELFLPEAVVEVVRGPGLPADAATGPDGVAAMVSGFAGRFDFLVQALLNARVELRDGGDPDRASARVTIGEYRRLSASGRFVHSAGTYHDRYERRGGRWRFAGRRYERTYVSEA